MRFTRQEKKELDILSSKIVQALSEVAGQYGMTTEEAVQTINILSNYLQMQGYNLPSNYERMLDELRTVSDAKTENLKQKTDLEIFEAKDEDKPIYVFKNGGTFTVENSKWDTDLLDKYFPHQEDPNTFSIEPYLKEEFQIKYDDDWIREILEEV